MYAGTGEFLVTHVAQPCVNLAWLRGVTLVSAVIINHQSRKNWQQLNQGRAGKQADGM